MIYEIPKEVQVFGKHIQKEQLKYHQKVVRVAKEFTFDSAHHLHCYEGKCKSLHGHTYKLLTILSGRVNELGIVVDFAEIKRIVKETVIDRLDHKYLNEVLPPMNTTAENMVVWIYEQVHGAIVKEGLYPAVRLDEVQLWETPTSYAAVTRAMMEAE